MILKFPKCSKLRGFNYLFPIDKDNAQIYAQYLSKKNLAYVVNCNRRSLDVATLNDLMLDSMYRNVGQQASFYIQICYRYTISGFYFGNVVVWENNVVSYYDTTTDTIYLTSHLTNEQKSQVKEMVYKSFRNFSFCIKFVEVERLEVASTVILKRTWDSQAQLRQMFFNHAYQYLYTSIIREFDKSLTIYRIPVVNVDILKEYKLSGRDINNLSPSDINSVNSFDGFLSNVETIAPSTEPVGNLINIIDEQETNFFGTFGSSTTSGVDLTALISTANNNA